MIEARWYQTEAVDSIYSYFSGVKNGNPVLALPTASGKSIIIANFLKGVMQRWPWQRSVCATHVKELIDQNFNKFVEAWPEAPAGVYSAGLDRRDTVHPIIFGGIQSMVKCPEAFGHRDLLLVDECHLISGKETSNYGKFIAGLKACNPKLKIIGLSATPYRMGSGMLSDGPIFTDVCYDQTSLEAFNRLLEEGFLALLIPKQTKTELHYEDVDVQNGDYVQNQLQHAVDKDDITYAACKEIIEQGYDRRSWLIFASGVEHSDHVAATIQSFGISAQSVHSKMDAELRDKAIRDFKSGELRCIVNNNVLTTGFDHPYIDLIGMLRPTTSTVLWVQMLGRGMRVAPGKSNCLVLDFAGNTRRLGPINDPVIPHKKGAKRDGGIAPIKICPECGVYNHCRAVVCIGCGATFEIAPKLTHSASELEIVRTHDPIIKEVDVQRILYHKHQKNGSPPILKVSYLCGLQMFSEYICIQHNGFPGRNAGAWWFRRMQTPMPKTVDEALEQVSKLPVPKQIKVWLNKKYPEVLSTIF